jgi:glycosyltransferase involved in cell wall biosynthesis
LRVLHFITPSKVSGAELLVLRLAQAQVRHGVTTRILCKRHAGFMARAQREGVDTCGASISGKLNLRAVSVLRAEIRRFQPDLVCTHLSSASLWGSLAARACGVPCIGVVHGFTSAFCYRFAPTLVCVSRAVADSMVAKRIAPDNLRVVYNGIDPQPFCAGPVANLPVPEGALCVGTVAHLSPKKGYTELIAAARLMPKAHFVVVGEGPMRPDLEEMARGPLSGRLHLLGFRDDIPDLMRRFDVFCLPSRREPFGLVLLEAMAASCPVVAFADGGVPEVVVHGETGLLAPPRNARALADCLQQLEADAALRQRMGAAGRERLLSTFTLEHTISRLQSVYREEMARQYPAAQGAETL